jgi:hypothetical protein
MDPKEKAKAGLWLLKQAVIDHLRSKPAGERPKMICEELGLHSKNAQDERKDYLMWGLQHMLEADGQARTEKDQNGHSVLVPILPASTQS